MANWVMRALDASRLTPARKLEVHVMLHAFIQGLAGNLEVVRAGEAVGDPGGLERYYRRPSTESLCYLALDLYAAGSIQRGSLLEGLLTKRLTG